MFQRNSTNFALFSLAVDIVLTGCSLALALAWRISPASPFTQVETISVGRWFYIFVPILWVTLFIFHSVYDPKKTLRFANEITTLIFAYISGALILAGVLYLTERSISRGFFIILILVNGFLLITWRIFMRAILRYTRWPFAKPKTIIVGAGDVGLRLAEFMLKHAESRLSLHGFVDDFQTGERGGLPILGTLNELKMLVKEREINDIIVALPLRSYEEVQNLVVELRDTATQVRVIPDYFNLALYRAHVQEYGGIPLINLREPALNPVQRLTKRIFDLVIASFALLIVSPIMLLVAIAIKVDSEGPILFKQMRIGENGHQFRMYKFRSMVMGAPRLVQVQNDGTIIHKVEDDPRVTKIGRFIRHTSLDELPQLLNVLKGDMSLVGPRPELPWLVEKYEPWQRVRFAVPQGITGWWQVNGRSDKPLHLNTNEDLYYIQNYSIWMDLKILFKTPLVVLRGKGAY